MSTRTTNARLSAKSIVILLLISPLLVAWVNSIANKVKSGNRQYKQGKFDRALEYYNDVLIDLPQSPHIHYNIGNSAYKNGDYGKALEAYGKSLFTDDEALEEKANYNIGNCKYKEGQLKENTNLTEAVQLFRDALDHYKRAIELNPNNTNTKFNHEFVERKLKELMNRQQENQETSDKEEEEQNAKSEDKQKQSAEEEAGEKQAQKESGSHAETSPSQKQGDSSVYDQQGKEKRVMTKEEAMQLLNSLKHEEQQQLPRPQGQQKRLREVFKDW